MAVGWRGQYQRYREFYLDIVTLYKQRADLRAFLEIILSLSTITIFIVFALKPTALTIISLIQEINEKRGTVSSLDQKIQALGVANNVFNQNQNQIPLVDSAVGSFAEPDVIAKQIVGLAGRDSVTLLGFSTGDVAIIGTLPKKPATDVEPLPGGAGEIPISISIKGNYTDIVNFAKDIENLRIPVKIDTFGINSSESEGGQVIVGTITGRVPFLVQTL